MASHSMKEIFDRMEQEALLWEIALEHGQDLALQTNQSRSPSLCKAVIQAGAKSVSGLAWRRQEWLRVTACGPPRHGGRRGAAECVRYRSGVRQRLRSRRRCRCPTKSEDRRWRPVCGCIGAVIPGASGGCQEIGTVPSPPCRRGRLAVSGRQRLRR